MYSRHYVEACNEWLGPPSRLSVWATQLRKNDAAVASRWRHCDRFNRPGNRSPDFRTVSDAFNNRANQSLEAESNHQKWKASSLIHKTFTKKAFSHILTPISEPTIFLKKLALMHANYSKWFQDLKHLGIEHVLYILKLRDGKAHLDVYFSIHTTQKRATKYRAEKHQLNTNINRVTRNCKHPE